MTMNLNFTVGAPPDMQPEPVWVHCQKCEHERILGYAPMSSDIAVALFKLPCGRCGSKKKLFPGRLPRRTNQGDAHAWLRNGDTGLSSETIWSVMMGQYPSRQHWRPTTPSDPSDFGRCYRLLEVMPEWRGRLEEVAEKYPEWRGLVDAWDELTALYEEELPSGTAPKLYERMHELLAEAGTGARR